MFPEANQGVFRGKEFSRLLIMLVILVVGWPVVLLTARREVPAPPPVAAQVSPLPPPDTSLIFRGLRDWRTFSSAETPAYNALVERVRKATPATLENAARHDVVFSQLIEDPARYRGIPIHITGTVRRILSQEVKDSKVFPTGRFYEGFVFTPDSGKFPYDIVFERPPADLLIGDNINQRISFNGYFLKLMLYDAADTQRVTPVLIGRFPPASTVGPAPSPYEQFFKRFTKEGTTWVLIALSIYFGIRIFFTLRKAMRPKSSPLVDKIRNQGLPNDHIEPDALADFLGGRRVEGEDEDDPSSA